MMAGRGLVLSEFDLLREILARRDPDTLALAERIGIDTLDDPSRERIRRAVVDELCELGDGNGRHAMELQELLTHIGEA